MFAARLRGGRPLQGQRSRLTGALVTLVLCGTLVLGVSPAVEAAPSADLQRYPYLTDLVGGSATVNFATVATGTDAASVRWGPPGSCTANTVAATRVPSFTVNGVSRWQWKATITGLSGDTQYCYRVFKGSTDLLGTDAAPTFRTQVPAGSSSPFSFVVFGDWAGGGAATSHQANLFQRIAASGARFALTTGDVPQRSGSTQTVYGDLTYPSSEVFGSAGWPVAGKSMAMFTPLGNHGRTLSGTRSPFLEIWPSGTAASTSGGRYRIDPYPSMNGSTAANYPSAWYAFDAGRIRFYVLDASWSNGNPGTLAMPDGLYKNDYDQHWAPGRAEYEWLKQDLEANAGKAKIATFHFPMWSANPDESSDVHLQGSSSLEGLLTRNGVKLVFNGHAHHYQRSKISELGLTQYVSGGGGADLHSISCSGTIPTFTAYAIAWSSSNNRGSKCPSSVPTPTSANQVYHFIKVTVNGTNVTITPTNEDGATFDVQTMNLAPAADTPPTVSVTAPTEGATVSGSSEQLAANAGDDQGVAGVQFKVDGANVGAEDTTAPYAVTWDTTSFSNGPHTITAVARDTAGQTTTSAPVNVTVSNGGGPPPTGINFVRQASGASTTGTTLNVNIGATAGDTLVASIAVAAGSSKQVTGVTDSTGGTWTKGPVGFQSGSNNRVEMWYRVNVPAGITRVTATLSASGVSSATVSEWSGVVDTAPVDQMAGRGNAASTTAATPTITTTNANDLVIASINYPGAVSSTLTTSGFTPLSNFNSGTSTNGRAAYRIVSTTGGYETSWTLSAATASGAAILALKGAAAPPSDMEDPTVSVTSPIPGPVSGTVNLAADATDNVGVVGVQFQVDGVPVGAEDTTAPYEATWNTTTATNGAHSVTAIARDAAGNTKTSDPVAVTVDNGPAPDTTPPGVSITAPLDGAAVKGTIPVNVDATDNVAVAGVQFKLDGADLGAEDTSAPYSVNWDTSTASEGTHTLTAVARDTATPTANTTTSAPVTVTVDRTEPTVSVTSPAEGATVEGTVDLAADAADTGGSGVTSVQFQVDGANVGSADTSPPYNASWDTTGLANGSSHTVTAIATDRAGNTKTSSQVNVTVNNLPSADTTPPTVSVTAPQNGDAIKGTIPVSATASDNVAVAGVQFRLDGANLGAEDTTAPYSVDWDTSTATEGTHTLSAVARDTATPTANTTTAAPVAVTVDRSDPTVSVTNPTAGATVSDTVNLAADAADSVSAVTSVQFQVDGANVGSADTSAPYNASWDTTGLANGSSHTVTAIATDRAGNTKTSSQVNVTVDNTPPPSTGPAFVRQAIGSVSTATTLGASISATAGHTLVASIALAAGGSKSVSAVTDSAGGTWTKGPVGFLAGANTRIEVWYRTNVSSGISSVTATLSASGAASMNVSEWSGVASASPVDQQAFRGNASSTTAATPSITTTNASAVVIGAVNYPGTAGSTLTTGDFTGLSNFSSGTSTNGRAAYRVVSSTGSYSVSWTLTAAAASGAAILALKGDGGGPPPPPDNPPNVSVTAPAAAATVSGSGVSLEATASDDIGVASVQFKVDGTNVGAADTTTPYQVNWDSTGVANGSHTVTAVARDTAGQTTTSSGVGVTVDNGAPPPTSISLVRQATAAGTAASLPIPVTATAAGNTLVSTIAVAAGSSKSVTGVTDSAGGTWTKGPVGFQSGSNTRVEIWFRTGVGAGVTSVTATLSAAANASANVSEWAGVATAGALDAEGAQGNLAGTTSSTPSVTTTNANDVLVGAINYPGTATSTLAGGGFTALNAFSSGTSTNGRAAYRIATATGAYQASWTLSAAATSGGALLALKGA
jgi:hypothetical protein